VHQANTGMLVQESRHSSRRRCCARDQRSVWVVVLWVVGWCFCACVRFWEMGYTTTRSSIHSTQLAHAASACQGHASWMTAHV
jgi:hypothetical protein